MVLSQVSPSPPLGGPTGAQADFVPSAPNYPYGRSFPPLVGSLVHSEVVPPGGSSWGPIALRY